MSPDPTKANNKTHSLMIYITEKISPLSMYQDKKHSKICFSENTLFFDKIKTSQLKH